jgi:hypothetical protein
LVFPLSNCTSFDSLYNKSGIDEAWMIAVACRKLSGVDENLTATKRPDHFGAIEQTQS